MGFRDILKGNDSDSDNKNKPQFKRTDAILLFDDISSILDQDDIEIIVTRGRGCETLHSNKKASERIEKNTNDLPGGGMNRTSGCKAFYACNFPDICEYCPNGGRVTGTEVETFELEDSSGRIYTGKSKMVNWIDSMPASIMMLRDVTQERENNDRLYHLAYVDQLTCISNRQKLKEDFAELEEGIASGEISGIIALFDLDNFKTVNDTYGHNTGDIILRRLAEHLQCEEQFSGHEYRLGGDEFVLLYSDPSDRFKSEDEVRDYYSEVLSHALLAYTLPNIDVKCTLSMGVSLFPKHGDNLSEVLRKADIALYKAKAEGRNRIIFFEEEYDSSQKFKDLYVNVQPILIGDGRTFGYELVDRGNSSDDSANTLTLDGFNRTLDALGLSDITNDLLYFISYSKQLLNPTVLRNLPRDKFVIQINIPVGYESKDLNKDIQLYIELKRNNYKLAFNGLNSGALTTEVLALADYVKFSPLDKNSVRKKIVIAGNRKIRFIATRVDTQTDYQDAKDTGFQLFQGFYFNQPVIGRKSKEVSPLKVNFFRLLKLCNTEGYMDFHEISSIISSDVALSYKLLRILNSAAVGLKNVSSITGAVAYLGEESLKKWVAVLALQGIADDKPLEIIRMSLIRARFGELMAPYLRVERNPKQVFMVGMLSLIHIALEITKEELLEQIPVSEDIQESLLTKDGLYSDLLHFYENYEYANWEAVSAFVDENQLDSEFVNSSYIAAVKWFNDLTMPH